MPDKDIVLAKTAAVQRCLKRIKDTTKLKPDTLDDLNTQDIFILNLQRPEHFHGIIIINAGDICRGMARHAPTGRQFAKPNRFHFAREIFCVTM